MSETWDDLTNRVFGKLDVPLQTTGDVKTNVQNALYETYREMIKDVNPIELFSTVSYSGVTDSTVSISIPTDLLITNLATPFELAVNEDPSGDGELETWNEISWEKWIKTQTGGLHRRPAKEWTIDPSSSILFSSLPASGETWDFTLYYYRSPAAFSGASRPETHEQHDNTLVNGATIKFPQYFSGDRQAAFAIYAQAWEKGLVSFQQEKAATRSLKQFRPRRGRLGRATSNVNWGI